MSLGQSDKAKGVASEVANDIDQIARGLESEEEVGEG